MENASEGMRSKASAVTPFSTSCEAQFPSGSSSVTQAKTGMSFSSGSISGESETFIADKSKAVEFDSIRVKVGLLDRLMGLAGELVLARNQIIQSVSSKNANAMESAAQRVDLITVEMQDAIMATRMQSIGMVFNKFKRIVRDFAGGIGKDVRLIIEGEEVELDKSIIEAIGEPLNRIIINAIEYGIETPDIRETCGKPRNGLIRISAHHEAGHVIIKVIDDGTGLDIGKVKARVLVLGLAPQAQLDVMSEKEIIRFVFRAGFSMTDKEDGKLCLEAASNCIVKLGGTIDMETQPGRGCCVTIKLPLTLAIIPSLLLSVGEERFAIPQVNLVDLVRFSGKNIKHQVEQIGNAMVIRHRGRLLPVVRMRDVIRTVEQEQVTDLQVFQEENSVVNIAVVTSGNFQYGLIVDELLDSAEIVVKSLGRHTKGCKVYAGATILGDGKVALILDLTGICALMKLNDISVENEEDARTKNIETSVVSEKTERRSLLIVTNGTNEFFGIPLELVARIEKIKFSEIEDIGGRKSIRYRGGILPLFRIEDAANVTPANASENVVAVVFKSGNRELGLIFSGIVDIVETDAAMDKGTYRQPGISGSIVVNNRITLLVDLLGLVSEIMPENLVEKEKSNCVREEFANVQKEGGRL